MASDPIEAYVDAVASRLGLTIDEAWKPRVATFVLFAQSMAAMVEESGALEDTESASIFTLREMP